MCPINSGLPLSFLVLVLSNISLKYPLRLVFSWICRRIIMNSTDLWELYQTLSISKKSWNKKLIANKMQSLWKRLDTYLFARSCIQEYRYRKLPPGWLNALRLGSCSTEIFACSNPPGTNSYVPSLLNVETVESRE